MPGNIQDESPDKADRILKKPRNQTTMLGQKESWKRHQTDHKPKVLFVYCLPVHSPPAVSELDWVTAKANTTFPAAAAAAASY